MGMPTTVAIESVDADAVSTKEEEEEEEAASGLSVFAYRNRR